MKHVLVTSDYFENAPYILVNNLDDLIEYNDMLTEKVAESTARLLKSNVEWDRYDHFANLEDIGDLTLFTSYQTCRITGGSPLFEVNNHIKEKMRTMVKYLDQGETVLINDKGGFCPYDPKTSNWIITLVDGPAVVVNVFTNVNPSLMNLENDADIEDRTKEYFKENKLELSYIKRLRKFDLAKLTEIFKKFREDGGYGLYVYTTGMDIPQMYEYCQAAVDAGLTEIKFEFSAGKEDAHEKLMQVFDSYINFEVIV